MIIRQQMIYIYNMIIFFPMNIALSFQCCGVAPKMPNSAGVSRILWDCSTGLVEFVAKFARRELGKPNSNSNTPRNYKKKRSTPILGSVPTRPTPLHPAEGIRVGGWEKHKRYRRGLQDLEPKWHPRSC